MSVGSSSLLGQTWLPTSFVIKEATKKVVGGFAFLLGAALITTELTSKRVRPAPGASRLDRWVLAAAKVSVLCTALSTPWSVSIASRFIGWAAPTWDPSTVFGPFTTFALNPDHPRHILSIAGAVLGIPALIKVIWSKAWGSPLEPTREGFGRRTLLYSAAFLTLVGRPALHLANAAARLMGVTRFSG